ncbi:hypothetical protein E2C01_006280 [Portunus trituberculatus]|uniref:Uncharacterized protein n=1 Tax=Portunus trituberculatus TaxID=210409 RepID=A0A5B7CUS9_PORTR|nr:hypothetical protein [Portunus trituberculatus]
MLLSCYSHYSSSNEPRHSLMGKPRRLSEFRAGGCGRLGGGRSCSDGGCEGGGSSFRVHQMGRVDLDEEEVGVGKEWEEDFPW